MSNKFISRWNEFHDLTVHTHLRTVAGGLQLEINFTARDLGGHKYAGSQTLDLADALLQLRAQKNAPPAAARALAAETAEPQPFIQILAEKLDGLLNQGKQGLERDTGFVLLLFPFAGGHCDSISNADQTGMLRALKGQIAILEAEPPPAVN